MKRFYFVLCIVLIFSILKVNATAITIGNGVSTNTPTTYPAPYGNWYFGAKHQFLILASELNAAGMTAGTITKLSFKVNTPNGVTMQGFTIAMKQTASTTISAFETGLTTVLVPQSYTDVTALNTHTFTTPFVWNGTSNIIVQTCFNNTSYTQNAMFLLSSTSFQSSIWTYADQAGVCGRTTVDGFASQRPNMVFEWNGLNLPPTASFTANPTTSCSGLVSFTDSSTDNPTSWLWYFGDGTTSNSQNPSHTYLSNGVYNVSLKACNANGCDSVYYPNYITVNTSASFPVAASCTPSTLTYCCGFGISKVIFNTINNSSNDGIDGYSNFTCAQTTVYEGQSYLLKIETTAPSTQNYTAWIDYNNDGVFNNTNEKVLTKTSQLNVTATINIPTGAVLNTPLRMRISADYDFSAQPTACGNLDYGQAEDYTVIINQNSNPPTPVFVADNTTSCNGTICFTDQSIHAPTSWLWNFGDGNTSNQQNPCHTYSTNGVYTVSLTVSNSNGTNTDSIVNYITVNTASQVVSASCSPSTLAYCCGYGITNVNFNTISNSSTDAAEGYQDFSCIKQTTVNEGNSYLLSISTGISNAQDTRAWIDFNNDGVFNNTNELVLNSSSQYNPSGNIVIPTGAVLNTPLRMRISSDVVGTAQSGCTNNDFGQTEDYGIIIQPNNTAPNSNFTASQTTACSQTINFTDLSTNLPTTWKWYFGDGTTSNLQNPSHLYLTQGYFTVSLVTTNAFGSDSTAFINYIRIVCFDTIPITGNNLITQCNGKLMDNGGLSNYADNSDGSVTIQPVGASKVSLTFISFDFENNFDSIVVYDGPSIASPRIAKFTGTTIPFPITSTGNSITIRQKSDFTLNRAGFELDWSCLPVGIDAVATNETEFEVYPNPAKNIVNIKAPSGTNIKIARIMLINTVGQVIQDYRISDTSIQLNVERLPKGLYFINISSNNTEVIKKLNIQ